MKIAVYAKMLSEERLNGVGVYTHGLLKALAEVDRENEYVLFTNEPLVHHVPSSRFREHLVRFPRLWTYLCLPFLLRRGGFDLFFAPKELLPFFPGIPSVVTVHDLRGLLHPERIRWDARLHFLLADRYVFHKADALVAVSGATRDELTRHCGVPEGKVTVTHLGFDRSVFRPVTDPARLAEVRAKHGLDGPYLLNTSSLLWYRKNLVRLVEAFALVRARRKDPDLKLVITGKRGESYEEVVATAAKLGLGDHLVLTGYIPLEDMPVLLSGAEALVFPSLDEGFGLPLIEAMACGCPVISSTRGAIPEVTGGAAWLVEPEDVAGLAERMEKVLADPEARERLRTKGFERAADFSWDRTARETLGVFERTARGAPAGNRP